MTDSVAAHYASGDRLAEKIAQTLRAAGKELERIQTSELGSVDEFHIRGRKATLELAAKMNLAKSSRVLDIGSGLGGPARTVAEAHGCHVSGIDLTEAFCDAARDMSAWVDLTDKTSFRQADATDLPFGDNYFDAAMTIHVAMNIANKEQFYAEARRVVKPGGIFAVYDVLRGEGEEVLFPVPWAKDSSISHLAMPDEMKSLLRSAGFKILEIHDSSAESQSWFENLMARMENAGPPPVTFQTFLGGDFPAMTRNQVQNLTERRIRTVSYICEA